MNDDEVLRIIADAADHGWEALNLSRYGLTEIPEGIFSLTNITTLNLYDNQIEQIPEAITNLRNLQTLDLRRNKIQEIPELFSNLSNLTSLNLSGNQIKKIPESFANLTSLIELYLFDNQIQKVPEIIANLTNLKVLALQKNQIREIPKILSRLGDLTSLSFAENQIQTIPVEITTLACLKILVLYDNQIKEIPQEIANLTNLEKLFINKNLITEVPETLCDLINLTELYLHDNNIQKLPKIIENFSDNLKKLDLRGNPIPISSELINSQDPKKILSYLRQLHTDARPLHEAKVLLVGQGNVGKTSLIERLIYNRYIKDQPQTDGLNVKRWNVEINSIDIRLNVWDFGGQEIYHATHQFFLTKKSLYLLVCNCRISEEENRIEYWLKLIGDESPVIIVGNKRDEQPLEINGKALCKKYPNIRGIIEVSCKTSDGIEELRTDILQQITNLKEVYDLLPLSWFEVKQKLEVMTEDFITYNRYLSICHENKITDEKDQSQLIELLHRLGLVLNFPEYPFLQNTNVLKPQWVTDGIYTLLSNDIIKTINKGIFTKDDLIRIFDPIRYPIDRHNYLINLMKQFELCFEIDCHPSKFLIPAILPKTEPEDVELEGEPLEFQYHYDILPSSIISRFIVLTHSKIHKETHWRSGVMLEYKNNNEILNIALVKADTEERKIFIYISGRKDTNTKRSFLAIIRDVFQKIHVTLPNLTITERIPVPKHPDHPPLDYQELLNLEAMGETALVIGKLWLRIDFRQILDGYESQDLRLEAQRDLRLEAQKREHDMRAYAYEDIRDLAKLIASRSITTSAEVNVMSQESKYTNSLEGATIANFANEVTGNARQQANQHIHQAPNQKLTEAAKEIKDLLDQLDKEYDRNTLSGQAMINAKAIEAIDKNPRLKDRIVNALKEGGSSALEELVDYPAIKILVATLKGFIDVK